MTPETLRIIDANFNRSREALRVMEEYARFVLDDGVATGQLKSLRHELTATVHDMAPQAQLLACTLGAVDAWEEDLFVVMNMQAEELLMSLPRVTEGSWHLAIDTAGQSPLDIIKPADQSVQAVPAYTVQSRSVVVFERR